LSLAELAELFEIYGLTIVFVVAAVFVVWYLIGGWINLRLMRRYARILEEHLKPRGVQVKYRRVSGGRGFRALCLPKDDQRFERVEVAINMADRDNAMHYPLLPIMHDKDRMICWGFLRARPYCAIEVASKGEVKALQKAIKKSPEKYDGFRAFAVDSEFDSEFQVFARTDRYLHTVFADGVRDNLLNLGQVIRNISVNESESFLRLSGNAKEATIPRLLDLVWDLGGTAAPRVGKA
jgi:hypothetical protein